MLLSLQAYNQEDSKLGDLLCTGNQPVLDRAERQMPFLALPEMAQSMKPQGLDTSSNLRKVSSKFVLSNVRTLHMLKKTKRGTSIRKSMQSNRLF